MRVHYRDFFHWLDKFMGVRKNIPAKDNFAKMVPLPC